MSRIDKRLFSSAIEGYQYLKERDDDAVFIKYRHDDQHYIDFIMQKKSWYYGEYACFDGSVFAFTVSALFLDDYLAKTEEAKTLKEALRAVEPK